MLRFPTKALETIRARFAVLASLGRGVAAEARRRSVTISARASPVELLVARGEAPAQSGFERALEPLLGQRHLHLVDLTAMAHVERELEAPTRGCDAVALHLRIRLLLEGIERAVDPSG